jgi:uroporphyrinogen-III synthase
VTQKCSFPRRIRIINHQEFLLSIIKAKASNTNAYCISPASYAKMKKLGILEEEYPNPVSNQIDTVISHLPQALKDNGKRIIQALQANSDFS